MAILGSTDLKGCNSIPDFIIGGSLVTFQQSAAPPSWQKQGTHNNKALRVVTGTATPGGSTAFTSVFASRTPSGTVTVSGGSVGNHTLTTPQIPSHNHGIPMADGEPDSTGRRVRSAGGSSPDLNTGDRGSNGAHNHPFVRSTASFSGNALDFAVQYVDIIICRKN